MPYKILHTEWSEGWGGQEMRIVAESLAFQKRGYQMAIACQPDSLIRRRAEEAGVPVHVIAQRKGLRLGNVRKALRLLRAQRPDLVHTHSSVDAWNFGVAARLLGIPIVRSRHLSTSIRTGWSSRLVYMRLADCVITSGQAIKDTMVTRNRMQAERIVSVPAGIDERRFHPGVDPGPVMREFGLSESDFVVGIVAVLRNWKGHTYLIQAVSKLVRAGRPVKLLIVGEGPQEKNLRALIQAEGLDKTVLLAGYRKDVPNFIAAMDCMVLPSTENEATSQVLPQAMAMQVPVIATDVGGLSEVVINHDTGLLIPPRDVDAIADAIAWISDHPGEARELAERGYAHCLDNFTFDRMIDRTEQAYRSVLAARVVSRAPRSAQSPPDSR